MMDTAKIRTMEAELAAVEVHVSEVRRKLRAVVIYLERYHGKTADPVTLRAKCDGGGGS